MRRSEIFENFVKIAEEKGLVSKGNDESVQKKIEKTRRTDSLSIEDISKLYGVKPNAPKESQYERNIIEKAHSDSVVISPSYDKLNGLVENINQRQDILLHIVNKQSPDGQLTQRKYAQRDLTLALVRVGNDMDNRGQDELRELADVCLGQVTSKIMKKQANPLWAMVIGLIAGVAGAIYFKQHFRFHSDGWRRDYQKAIAEIDDLLNSNSNWGVGYQYRPEFLQMLNELKIKLDIMNTAVEQVMSDLDKLEEPHGLADLQRIAADPTAHQAIQSVSQFKNVVNEIYPYLEQVVDNFTNEGYKQRQIVDTGWISSLIDKTDILHGGKGFIADDFDDVAHALETLFIDLKNILQSIAGATNYADNMKRKIQAAQISSPVGGMPAATTKTKPTPPSENPIPELSGVPSGVQTGENTIKNVQTNFIEDGTRRLLNLWDNNTHLK
jgi:hypothetical protein